MAAAGLCCSAAAGGLLKWVDVTDAVTSIVVPGIPGLAVIADEVLTERRKSRSERLQDFLGARVYRRPIPLAVTTVLGLLFLERLLLLLLGISGSLVVWWTGNASIDALTGFVLAESFASAFVIFPLGLTMVFVGRYMTHRIQAHPLAWITSSALCVVALDIAFFAVLVDALNLPWDGSAVVAVYVTLLVFLLVGGMAGNVWARKEARAYVMKRLFARLSREDQQTVIELVQSPAAAPAVSR